MSFKESHKKAVIYWNNFPSDRKRIYLHNFCSCLKYDNAGVGKLCLLDVMEDLWDWGWHPFSAIWVLEDDDIYKRIQIYNPQFSYNIDILVDQVSLETDAPSGYYLKDQVKKAKADDRLRYMQVPKQKVVKSHKLSLIQQLVDYHVRLMAASGRNNNLWKLFFIENMN